MIPRRRTNDESVIGANANASNANANVIINVNAQKPNVNSNSNNSNSNNSNSNGAAATFASSKNRRVMIMFLLLTFAGYWLSKQEERLLDEDHYEDARKEYLKKNSHHERYSTIETHHRNPRAASGKFVLEPENEFTPAIAWLMSFPNSGTSFTMTMVARSSMKSFATNYGDEVIALDEPNSLSIYPRRPEGPFWPGMSGKMHTPRDLPDKYVITKTHCGSRCSNCGPDEYIESPEEFLRRCTLGHARLTPAKERRKYDVEYPSERVHKAIHLIRNPMHNIIARYHLEHRHKGYKNDTAWQNDHSNDAEGLHKWCEAFDNTYLQENIQFYGSETNIPKAPCHGEFYKWTQWHNLAHATIRIMRGEQEEGFGHDFPARDVPVLRVYYEDYNTNFQETAGGILTFLELEQVAPFREFASRKDYGEYFTDQQLKEIRHLVKTVATEHTWRDVKHYFAGVGVGVDTAAASSSSSSAGEANSKEEEETKQ